jgi:predicted amidohydrolase
LATQAIGEAGAKQTDIICFPECYVPGYRAPSKVIPSPDAEFLERAWDEIAQATAKANIGVILGTERLVNGSLFATSLVIDPAGSVIGFQDKVQIAPSDETTYTDGSGRHVFEVKGVKFGIAICHEGWRYPETVRWAAAEHRSCFTRIFTKLRMAVMLLRALLILRTHSTKKPCSAARPRIRAGSSA